MRWNPAILNKFVAPDIATFSSAEILDLTDKFPQANYWVANHFLNNALGASFKDRWRQVVLAYLRRSHNAFSDYHEARSRTLAYLDGNQPDNPKVGQYFDAVSSWESFALQFSIAIDLFRWLNQGEGAFKKNDGSKEQRLYTISNLIKHMASAVDSGQCGESDAVPLWLGNSGLQSFGIQVTFSEAAEILDDLSTLANTLQNPDSFRRGEGSS